MYDIFEPNDRRLHEEAKAERAELESATLAVQELIVKLQQAERERDEAGDAARAAIRDALLLKEQAERERDEAFRISEQERADWKLSVEAWQHHYEEEKEALRLERGRKLDALVKYEQLRKVLEEIAAYEDDCIHRRMARAALGQMEQG